MFRMLEAQLSETGVFVQHAQQFPHAVARPAVKQVDRRIFGNFCPFDRAAQPRREHIDQFVVDGFLAAEILVEHGLRDARLRRDFGHADTLIADPRKFFAGDVKQPLAGTCPFSRAGRFCWLISHWQYRLGAQMGQQWYTSTTPGLSPRADKAAIEIQIYTNLALTYLSTSR